MNHMLIAYWTIKAINSLDRGWLDHIIFKLILVFVGWSNSSYIALRLMSLDLTDKSNIGSGNGLVLPGNKPLPEPMLTQIYVAIWHH